MTELRAPRPAGDRRVSAVSVAIVTDGRPADELRARIAALPRVARAIVVPLGHELSVDVAIVEVGPRDCAGSLQAIERLARTNRVLAIGPVALSSRSLRLGATAYVAQGDLEAELDRAIAAVLEGRKFLGTSIAEHFLNDGLAVGTAVNRLSTRELEVLCRAGSGEDPTRTAQSLGVAPEAVTQYRLRARAKLGLGSTTELAAFAAAHGLH